MVAQQPYERNLKVFNSFTRKKEPFVSNHRRSIKWYSCGPTVYDVAHLGHARCYITFDIIRRILSDYFGYQVFYVVNITDIDDKIIKRARSIHLCDEYIANLIKLFQTKQYEQIEQQCLNHDINLFIDNFNKRRQCEQDPAKVSMYQNTISKSLVALEHIKQVIVELKKSDSDCNMEEITSSLNALRDVIADERDTSLGHTVTDHEIFKTLTLSFEQEYHDDMRRLDVLPPNALPRVSEYIDEVGHYIRQLETNGYAYRSNGSIYFDTEKFDANPKHSYAKLVREAYGHKKDLDEGEGELSCGQQDKKKSPGDFALWKKSKPGEPEWRTQDFEPGRPGWHIECSVMASKLLGENFDIHSGGYDLKFPHHDNEIAQAEAYYDTGKDWVNYFIHSGHLTISGCKMSKSLKNFITIRQALEEYTSRQLRFAFLVHGWTETLDYSSNTMSTALSYEKTFREFFLNMVDTFRRQLSQTSSGYNAKADQLFKKWTDSDIKLNQEFLDAVNEVDAALCDNFDTRTVLNVLSNLVRECNKQTAINSLLAQDITSYIVKILSIFGANFNEINLERYLAPVGSDGAGDKQQSSSDSEATMKYVETLAQFRADVRRICKGSDSQQSIKQLLMLCDQLRDTTLPSLGVRLEDREVDGAPYVVKLVDPETLAKEKALAERMEQEKRLKMESQRLEKLRLQQEREEKAKIPPSEMFRSETDKYSQFDDKGIPTHDVEGKELSKSARKKLEKMFAEQEKKHNKFLADHRDQS